MVSRLALERLGAEQRRGKRAAANHGRSYVVYPLDWRRLAAPRGRGCSVGGCGLVAGRLRLARGGAR